MKMGIPTRATTCNHLQCYDAATFLQMNEKKATWLCPVCDKPAEFDNLVIDGYAIYLMLLGDKTVNIYPCNSVYLAVSSNYFYKTIYKSYVKIKNSLSTSCVKKVMLAALFSTKALF